MLGVCSLQPGRLRLGAPSPCSRGGNGSNSSGSSSSSTASFACGGSGSGSSSMSGGCSWRRLAPVAAASRRRCNVVLAPAAATATAASAAATAANAVAEAPAAGAGTFARWRSSTSRRTALCFRPSASGVLRSAAPSLVLIISPAAPVAGISSGSAVVTHCIPPSSAAGGSGAAADASGGQFAGRRRGANRATRRKSKADLSSPAPSTSASGAASAASSSSGPSTSPVSSPVAPPSAGGSSSGGGGGGVTAAALATATAEVATSVATASVDSDSEYLAGDAGANTSQLGNQIVPFARRQPRALVLDCAYRPINVLTWYKAFHFEYYGRGEVLEYYPPPAVCSTGSGEHPLPAVLRVPQYTADVQDLCSRVACTRRNVMVRDGFCCQYCGSRRDLTIDHVHPASKGGKETWDNLVTACMRCNQKKSDRSLAQLGWKLKRKPKEPTPFEIGIVAGIATSDILRPPPEWEAYIAPYRERLETYRQAAVEAGLLNLIDDD
ncbi:hypothetical protein HYH02_012472 [Chlamydomonas schloesseri]|uniref:HNH nuclease domain-containing protein n=1 Tax=Chlamydomonas schloesseri TaxID=2026947 RepID=A0A835SYW8_9CHLO|nr:hypothetical protein HYH02_012472 [Chlamydomonas schloesseri]|eukprot:KAG2434012.1 hypothetical protein HYH02_012472 [Chlamydomonas schloesseri]